MDFTKNDCVELFYALNNEALKAKIGIDGEALAAGTVTLTPEEAEIAYFDMREKREKMATGFFDDFPGQIEKRGSFTARWAEHLSGVMVKLMTVAAGSNENHVSTGLHRVGCVSCQMAYDKHLPDEATV